MSAYYNEIDPFAAQWLRNLIAAGHIADGVVDTRSIEEVEPNDLKEFTQCHFFAGIGVWSHALRLAGWPDDRPVWTGSCPCQPFSVAGKAGGFDDERHLWPAFHHLIKERHPTVVFGEQVASKDGLAWLDLVYADLEGEGYAVGAADLCAAGVGAPHIRQRLYWVADTNNKGLEGRGRMPERADQLTAGANGLVSGGANTDSEKRNRAWGGGQTGRLELADRRPTNGFWRDVDWLGCRDGKWRPVEPGTFPLAHGVAGRVGRLRAYGNAINAYQAEAFITAYLESL
jgi:DNA (cytosine-5)-methyltransferase 1